MFYPHLQTLLDHALALKFQHVEIFSNLTVFPKWLFERRYRTVNLASPFYSAGPITHDQICSTKGSFDRTVASIRKVISAGLPLRIGFVEMPRKRFSGPTFRSVMAARMMAAWANNTQISGTN